MTRYPEYIGYVSVGIRGRQVPVDEVEVLDAQRDYTGHDVYVTYRYRGVTSTSRLVHKLKKD